MSLSCEVHLRWDATPAQQKALGSALWGWCARAAGASGLYPQLDNQGLADLLAGRLPAARPPGWGPRLPCVQFLAPGDPARDREAVLEGLRRALPGPGTADVRVEGLSWVDGARGPAGLTPDR